MTSAVRECPSCGARVSPDDFLCPDCECIIDPSQVPVDTEPTDVSLVRRLLEAPQRKVPSAIAPPRASAPPPPALGDDDDDTEATSLMQAPQLPEGVPVVVAQLSRAVLALSEFEAWVVSLIDGSSDAAALAERAGLSELEARVVLLTLRDKRVVDFTAPPGREPVTLETRGDAVASALEAAIDEAAPEVSGGFEILEADEAPPPLEADVAPTDPRIAARSLAKRSVLDALKQVPRRDATKSTMATPVAAAASQRDDAPKRRADLAAEPALQVALRMEQHGRGDDAIRFLEHAVAKSPDAASLYNRLAIILMRERADYRRAETMLQKALRLDPANRVYATNLRQVLARAALKAQRR